MKTILAVGDLDNFTTVYQASLVAMMAGGSRDSLFSKMASALLGGPVIPSTTFKPLT